MLDILLAKPVLIGLHLGFAILGIDAFLWLAGEYAAGAISIKRRMIAAVLGLIGFIGSWLIGGYYYVKYYGPLVKPIIKAGSAPWAHAIAMEAKEHIFLFLIPMAVTALILSRLSPDELDTFKIRKSLIGLILIIVGLGFATGLFGFIISAAARWGVI